MGGPGGIGKSKTISDELDRLGVSYILTNSRLTGRGLVDHLEEYPTSVHVIEDIEESIRDPQAKAVLMSATWGTRRGRDGRTVRWITWRAHGVHIEFPFTGGIAMTTNLNVRTSPQLAALKSRISWCELEAADEEIAALMRKIALDGYRPGDNELEPERCWEVVDFIIQESRRINRRLDLRLLVNSFEDRLQVEDGESGCSWSDLVASRIHERPSILDPIESIATRVSKKMRQLKIARELGGVDPDQRFNVWQERTGGLSRATMYRRLAELASADALVFEA